MRNVSCVGGVAGLLATLSVVQLGQMATHAAQRLLEMRSNVAIFAQPCFIHSRKGQQAGEADGELHPQTRCEQGLGIAQIGNKFSQESHMNPSLTPRAERNSASMGRCSGSQQAMSHICLYVLFWALVCASTLASDTGEADFERYNQGKFVFERNCMVCHGPKGDGNGEMAPTLSPRPRSFREGMFKFRTTPFGKMPTDDDLRHTIRNGLSGTAMGMFDKLTDEDLTNVVAYVKSFSRRWRKPENFAEPMSFPALPKWFAAPDEAAVHAEKGKALFVTNCASCHGATADGKGLAAVGLKDVWGLPAHPSDLRQPHLRCGDRAEDIYRVLSTGLNGTPMVSFETTLTPDQRWDIISWILTQKLPDVPNLGSAPQRNLNSPPAK